MNPSPNKIFFYRISNTRGSLFVMVYLLIAVLVVLGAAFLFLSTAEGRVAERQRRTTRALYIAEAGLERALYDLRLDFVNAASNPSWADCHINSIVPNSPCPSTSNYYALPYTGTSLNGGSYSVELKNVLNVTDAIWVKSVGIFGDATQTIQVYARIDNLSPWNNAIFAGAGASGAMVNGNVNIRGSVHILGTGLTSSQYAIDLGGTAELVGNNYGGLATSLAAKVPALPTVTFGGETVSTLNAKLRVKRGKVGLSGSATVGEANLTGNTRKETVDGSYVTDGFGGSQGTGNVYSDNGWSNGYDLGNSVTFPSLSDPYSGYNTYQEYLRANALVINNSTFPAELAQLGSLTPTSSFTAIANGFGSIGMSGGNLSISGIVYIEGGNLNMSKAGSNKTITYSGTGSILVTGDAQIDVNLITSGNNSFPTNILGLMTPGIIGFNEASIDVMGLFYAEQQVTVAKQTDIVGTIVSNYFDMGSNVPSIFQVPETINHLPPGLIGQTASWVIKTVSWQKI